jgi:glycine/sarcosine N-methyltransferase
MDEIVRGFYDALAPEYRLIFADWEASMARQAAALHPILERECGTARSVRVLDCACGIGTQAIGLAKLGYRVTGSDLSGGAIERARQEVAARGLDCALHVADMRDLSSVPESGFDAVICMDNALPHLMTDADVAQAAAAIRGKLRGGGIFLASIRDYDRLLGERPTVQGPAFYTDAGRRRMVFQLWDWKDEQRYEFHMYITRETADGWHTHHGASMYRALLPEELTPILEGAGFQRVRWMAPAESGFYQPLVLAVA